MPPKKENHIIPKCLIKQWKVEGDKYMGVHVFDAKKDSYNFSSSNGGAYSFTAENYFYTPKINNERVSAIEDFFAPIESTLASVIQKIKTESFSDFLVNRKTFDQFLLAILSLKFRTKLFIESTKKQILDGNLPLRFQKKAKHKDLDVLVLESMMDTLNEEYLSYRHAEIFILKNDAGNFILGDEPFVGGDYILKGNSYVPAFPISFIPLTPHFAIAMVRATQKTILKFVDYPDELTSSLNDSVAEQSEYWLVGTSKEKIKPYTSKIIAAKPPLKFRIREALNIKKYYTLEEQIKSIT